MPPEQAGPVRVEFTPEFGRNVRRLQRKYPGLRADIEPLIEQLAKGGSP
jgi:hypothetical protein